MPTNTTDPAAEMTDVMKLAGDLIFRASRIEIHAKELFDTAHQLRAHLVSKTHLVAGTDEAIERALLLMPDVKAIVDLGIAARALRDAAVSARAEFYTRRIEQAMPACRPALRDALATQLHAYAR